MLNNIYKWVHYFGFNFLRSTNFMYTWLMYVTWLSKSSFQLNSAPARWAGPGLVKSAFFFFFCHILYLLTILAKITLSNHFSVRILTIRQLVYRNYKLLSNTFLWPHKKTRPRLRPTENQLWTLQKQLPTQDYKGMPGTRYPRTLSSPYL